MKYWEIGNESWLNNETWTNRTTPATYAADLVEFSRRMKAEDSAIQVGTNGDTDAWWRTMGVPWKRALGCKPILDTRRPD